jgi:uncharacterized protein (DUF1800 family)
MKKVSFIGLPIIMALTACGGGGSADSGNGSTPPPQTVTPAPSVTFTVNKDTFLTDEAITLTWSATNATSCLASGVWEGAQSTSGNTTLTFSTAGALEFSLQCSGAGGSRTENISVDVNYVLAGTILESSCNGTTQVIIRADGTGGQTQSSTENATECGYVPPANTAPVAKISMESSSFTASTEVVFSGLGSTDAEDESLSYRWEFNKPKYSSSEIKNTELGKVSFRPDAIGEYQLTLHVTDSAGETTSIEQTFIPEMPTPIALPKFTPTLPPVAVINDKLDAVRLLKQATFGPTSQAVTNILEQGAETWFNEQTSMTPWTWVKLRERVGTEEGDPVDAGNGREWIFELFTETAQNAPDQLRQRVIYILSQLFVVSKQTDLGHRDNAFTTYWDTMGQHAFGNFRDLLKAVTLHPTMGHYLNMMSNQKADPENNIRPDENFAREVMQLFTIGLKELNQDGTVKFDNNGEPLETYNSETVRQYAAALTGWYYDTGEVVPEGENSIFGCSVHCWPIEVSGRPMIAHNYYHQKTEKQLLRNYYIPPGQSAEEDLETVIDSLFYHPNLAPFFAQHLIRQMVTSNPTPEYVGRVSAVFNNNGNGIRGDIKATVKAVLFDVEARKPEQTTNTLYGKVKEPLLKATHVNRLFNVSYLAKIQLDPDNLWGPNKWLRFNHDPSQVALDAESVFNFFRPDFSPLGSISEMGYVAPEMQITTEDSVVNDMEMFRPMRSKELNEYDIKFHGRSEYAHTIGYDFTELDAIWEESGYTGVIDFLDIYMTAGRMSDEYKAILLSLPTLGKYDGAGDGQPSPFDENFTDQLERHLLLIDLIYIVMTTPEFSVQK